MSDGYAPEIGLVSDMATRNALQRLAEDLAELRGAGTKNAIIPKVAPNGSVCYFRAGVVGPVEGLYIKRVGKWISLAGDGRVPTETYAVQIADTSGVLTEVSMTGASYPPATPGAASDLSSSTATITLAKSLSGGTYTTKDVVGSFDTSYLAGIAAIDIIDAHLFLTGKAATASADVPYLAVEWRDNLHTAADFIENVGGPASTAAIALRPFPGVALSKLLHTDGGMTIPLANPDFIKGRIKTGIRMGLRLPADAAPTGVNTVSLAGAAGAKPILFVRFRVR